MCARCRRPEVVCYCAQLPQLPTRTRVVVLQHPRERRVGIGTARMAQLALPNSILRVGIDFAADDVVTAALAGPAPSYLLFPGPDARDVRQLSRAQPITLVVVDGTWSQARTLVRLNPRLAALPRIAFTPRQRSAYDRIRKEPADFCVSTIEALAEVLSVLEPDGEPFDPMLVPFHAMVARQERFASEIGASRHQRRERPTRPRGPTLAMRLAAAWPHLVCVQGEANGWPARHPGRHEPEIVHFVAWRPATGERYEAVIAPRRPLAPLTPQHIELPRARLVDGDSVESWRRSWQAFCAPDDVLLQWGSFYTSLAAADGLTLTPRRIDLRGELTQSSLRLRGGTLEDCAARLGLSIDPLGLDGRGGRRLAALAAIASALASATEPG